MTPDAARDALYQVAAYALAGQNTTAEHIPEIAAAFMPNARWVVDAILSARAPCPKCWGTGHRPIPPDENGVLSDDKDCECGGEPGGPLVLAALCIDSIPHTYQTHVRDDQDGTITVELPCYVQLPLNGWDSWRFPVPSTPDVT